jgi:hypothetical protein
MSIKDAYKEMIEKAIKEDHVKRIMMLRQQDFPVESIAAVYEMTSDDVEKVIRDNKNDFEWGLKD